MYDICAIIVMVVSAVFGFITPRGALLFAVAILFHNGRYKDYIVVGVIIGLIVKDMLESRRDKCESD